LAASRAALACEAMALEVIAVAAERDGKAL